MQRANRDVQVRNADENVAPIVVTLAGRAHAYDGDSLFFGRVEVRLEGIDAPELRQACKDAKGNYWPCGVTARDRLARMVNGQVLRCTITGKDRYRRLIGSCYSDGRDVGAAMVLSGNAICYHYFSEHYARQEISAQSAHRGIWQDAAFTEPYYCRHLSAGHDCYAYDEETARVVKASQPLSGKPRRRAVGY